MKRFLALSMILGVTSFGLVGCGEESKVTETTTATTPDGETKVTEETKVETSGENPPAAVPADGAPAVEPPK